MISFPNQRGYMRASTLGVMLVILLAAANGLAFGATQAAGEPLSKTYRVTRANDVEFQKIEPFKVFDNLYYVGPGYVSVWLLTTPEGNILFDTAQDHAVMQRAKFHGLYLATLEFSGSQAGCAQLAFPLYEVDPVHTYLSP